MNPETEIPDAPTQTLAVQDQLAVVREHVLQLTVDNPEVSFELDQPLSRETTNLLLKKGYCVETSSSWSNVNGDTQSQNKVRLSLPGADVYTFPSFTIPKLRALRNLDRLRWGWGWGW